jgi:glycosyltransferase involved in cell wall biosynthesis
MKILFDHQVFSLQDYGGASKYFVEVLKRMPKECWRISIHFSNNFYLKQQALARYVDFLPDKKFPGKNVLMDYMNRPETLMNIVNKREPYDIFHQTYYSSYYFPYLKNKKVVTTFHDMNYTKYQSLYKKTLLRDVRRDEELQKISVKRADHIIAVSQFTKDDLVERWNIHPDKITVVHHGVDKDRIDFAGMDRICPNPYLLYVGERGLFKNFSNVLKAFELLSIQHPELRLICTGMPFSPEELNDFRHRHMEGKILHVRADEYTLARLYHDAEVFVYASYSEGFGMPLLEAMVYDCPVAVSNASCLPEVAGEAGVYFDPFQYDDMAEKIGQLLASAELRSKFVQLGQKRLEQFSWEKSANEHMAVYQSLLR